MQMTVKKVFLLGLMLLAGQVSASNYVIDTSLTSTW